MPDPPQQPPWEYVAAPQGSSWLDSVESTIGRIAAAPSLPLKGNDGDILVMRGGQPTWVNPREALGIHVDREVLRVGMAMTHETIEAAFLVEAREPVPVERPEPRPTQPVPKKYRTAWERVLDDD